MEFKDAQGQYIKLKHSEERETISRINLLFTGNSTRFDLSNYFLFDKSSKLLLNRLKGLFISKKLIKHISLQNCSLSGGILIKILKLFTKFKQRIINLDISNNKLTIEPDHTEIIAKIFSSNSNKRSLILRGNIFSNPVAVKELFSQEIYLKELNLYDSGLSAEALSVLTKAISLNRTIEVLNIGYNSSAFENCVIVNSFGLSIGENSTIATLVLNENVTLGNHENLKQLFSGIKQNRSLEKLCLAGINLEDKGMKLLASLLTEMPLSRLDIQNNNIQDLGFSYIMENFPKTLTALDISYNNFHENSSILSFASLLVKTKSLRKLNISNCFELDRFNQACTDILCEALIKNDSLAKLKFEGIKIPDNPDEFCNKLSSAIDIRKLSLTYKISAVYCGIKSSEDSLISNELSIRFISKAPSAVWAAMDLDSGTHTQRKSYIDSPNQEPIAETSGHITFTTSFD